MRGRFAPTPSGSLHLGNVFVALIAWLQVRKNDGTMILRIEDLDQPRSRPELIKEHMADLKWLGLDWDEGPGTAAEYSWRQSRRTAIYEKIFKNFEERNLIYPCYCSRKELREVARAPHGLGNDGYPGFCRKLTEEERREKTRFKKPSYRFKLPAIGVAFTDQIQGEQQFSAGAGGDFVIKRADDIFSYQLAVVADDADMGVTHVVRGSDLLDSTPRQLRLYEALEFSAPHFAHVPLVLGPDGVRLSKRHGSAITVRYLRENGVATEKVIGFLSYLAGLLDSPQAVSLQELVTLFDIHKIRKETITLSENWEEMMIGK